MKNRYNVTTWPREMIDVAKNLNKFEYEKEWEIWENECEAFFEKAFQVENVYQHHKWK